MGGVLGGGGSTINTSESRIEALNIQSSAYGVTVPVVWGINRVAGNMLWYGAFTAIPHTTTTNSGGGGGKGGGGGVTQNNTTYTYTVSFVLGLCEGPITGVTKIWRMKEIFSDGSTTALAQIGLSLASGSLGQATWSYLTTTFPANAIGYSGVANAYAAGYDLGGSSSLENLSFEVVGQYAYGAIAGVPDANPPTIMTDAITNSRYGAGFPSAQIASLTNWSNYCIANKLLVSPALAEQMQAGEFITKLCAMTNSAPVWTAAGLNIIPYGDAAITANGATYTPNLTAVYDLTDDDFTPSQGADPIKVTRKPQSDAYNSIRIEFLNRANYYNIEIAEAKDSANIDAYGLRAADVVSAHWICDASIARAVAQLMLQRALYIRNTYEFSLPWTKTLLEPMDLLTLTDSGLGLNKKGVRIISLEENESGDINVTAEEFSAGLSSSPLFATQLSSGYQHNFNAVPGSVSTPMFFEAPIERTTTGLEVYCAVTGLGANWGGCNVWVSLDGTNYKMVQTIYGGARYGTLTGPIAAGNCPVIISDGQLLSGSAADAANLTTLCYIGGANPEYLAYTTATLTGVGAYNLGGLTRSAFGTSGAAHATSDKFARVDDAIATSGPLDLSLIGKTIYFKFTSFNQYQAANEDLAAVTAYTYTITGALANLPPPPFDNFAIVIQPDGTRQYNFSYNSAAPVDWMGAQIRYMSGTFTTPDWNAMIPLQDTATYYTHSPIELNAPLSGAYTFACKSEDQLGNLSSYVVRNVILPNRRLGNVFAEYFEMGDGWLGTKTGCQVIGTYLEALDTTTWATAPATWTLFTRWNTTPTSPITYVTPVRDFGTLVAGQVNPTVDADGTVLIEMATSADGITWGAWGSGVAPFSTRYMKLRLTVTANGTYPVPVVRDFTYQINAPIKSENINNLVISTLTGAYRIGVGDIRIPLVGTYSFIKQTTVVIQDSSAGTWTYARIDQSLSPSPRWQFRLNGVLADPAFVDFFIEGY